MVRQRRMEAAPGAARGTRRRTDRCLEEPAQCRPAIHPPPV